MARWTATVVVSVIALAACSGSSTAAPTTNHTKPSSATTHATATTTAPTHVVVAAAPFQLSRPSARAALVADGDHLLLLGGFDGAKQTIGDIMRIDPPSRSTRPAGRLPTAVHDAAGALVAGRPMVFGGGNSTETAGVQAVNSDGTVVLAGSLPIPRSDLATATVGTRTFIVGGYDGSRVRATTVATSDGSHFDVLGDLPVPVRYPAVAALGSLVYAVGGTTNGNSSGAVTAVQVLDTATGTVRKIGDIPQPLTDAVAATVRGHIYIFGGQLAGRISDQVWRLDVDPAGATPVTLTPVATLPSPVTDAAITVWHDVAYLVGGESPSILPTITTLEVR